MPAFLAFLAKPAIAGLVKWAIGAATAYFIAKPVIEKWGSTPANRAEQAGVSKLQLYEDAKKRQADKRKYYDERNKEVLDEIKELKEQLDKLEKQKINQAQEIANEDDPAEKARKMVMMQETEKKMGEVRQQIKAKERQIEHNNKELEKAFDDIGNVAYLSEEQFNRKSNTPDLGSWMNWGIIGIGVITAILIVKFIFGVFKKFSKGIE